ncbi:MAG: DUF1499 domain-containing protein [Limisphaerales bacterium]|nr:hypothetical protein [Pedosphaera sp.]MEC7904406.1 DUF1499 domain-containing protein [Verrucomicrobiota bacterium]MEC9132041.1 DUF1499 domain-containing protein [Verrucomicrobiota bacterium]HBF02216.1 DUF1499 domain-containing protein [Verrucomicrobiales bacterium]
MMDLSQCPSSPNCVSSQTRSAWQSIPPIAFDGCPERAWKQWCQLIETHPLVIQLVQEERNLHAVFRTRWFRFRDDLHSLLCEEEGVIHVRSASRLGYWDMNANRRRVEDLRHQFQSAPST